MSPGRGALLGLVLALLVPLSARALPEQTWVVAIGHNEGAASEVGLLYAEQDARLLVDVLREHGGVSSRRMLLLLLGETSSAAGEASQESDRLRGSFFTHHLVNALRGAADPDDDGNVTLTEAYGYTYAQTLRSSGQTVALQHPTYSWEVKGRGELVLSTPTSQRGRTGRLRLFFTRPSGARVGVAWLGAYLDTNRSYCAPGSLDPGAPPPLP